MAVTEDGALEDEQVAVRFKVSGWGPMGPKPRSTRGTPARSPQDRDSGTPAGLGDQQAETPPLLS
jgi:hypothetical protein